MTATIVIDMDGEAFRKHPEEELWDVLDEVSRASALILQRNPKPFILHDSDGNPCGKFTVTQNEDET